MGRCTRRSCAIPTRAPTEEVARRASAPAPLNLRGTTAKRRKKRRYHQKKNSFRCHSKSVQVGKLCWKKTVQQPVQDLVEHSLELAPSRGIPRAVSLLNQIIETVQSMDIVFSTDLQQEKRSLTLTLSAPQVELSLILKL